MALTLFWRCETETLDGTHDFTGGDNTAAPNNLADLNADQAKVGTNSHDNPTGDDYYTFVLASSDIVQSEGAAAFWFYPNGFTATQDVWVAEDASDTANRLKVEMTGSSGSGGFLLEVGPPGGGAGSISTGDIGITNGNWYFVTFGWDDTNTSLYLHIFDNTLTEVATKTENTGISSAAFPTWVDLDRLDLGFRLGAGDDAHFDNYFIADSYAEDLVSNANITSYTAYGGATIEVPVGPWR